jgi:hypothetical protein
MIRQAQELMQLRGLSPDSRLRLLAHVRHFLTQLDWDQSPPRLGQMLHCFLRHLIGHPDPYAAVKRRLTQRAHKLYPTWHRQFHQVFPPLEAAVRLAIVGNLLDVGAKTQLDDRSVRAAFEDALAAPLLGAVHPLAAAIAHARSILYLADNAGEMVFDQDLLARLPAGRFALVVRGGPVLNDATLADARQAGLENGCEILSNGSDAPGTLLDDCSPAFRERFAAADLILAKGQGNYESLAETDKHVFFLLKVKCAVLAEALHCPVGSLVLHEQRPAHEGPDGATGAAVRGQTSYDSRG